MENLEARLGEMMAEVKSMRMKMEELKRSSDEQEVAVIENKKKQKKQNKKIEKVEGRLCEMMAEEKSIRMKMEELKPSSDEQEVAVVEDKKKQQKKVVVVEGPITPDKEESRTNISANATKRKLDSSDDDQPLPKRAKRNNFNPSEAIDRPPSP